MQARYDNTLVDRNYIKGKKSILQTICFIADHLEDPAVTKKNDITKHNDSSCALVRQNQWSAAADLAVHFSLGILS